VRKASTNQTALRTQPDPIIAKARLAPPKLEPAQAAETTAPAELSAADALTSANASGAGDKPADVYEALQLSGEQRRRAKDVLAIQRERIQELSQSLREKKISLPEFKQAVREMGNETDANLLSVFGDKKLDEWRRFQSEQYPAPESAGTAPQTNIPASSR
jgi:hypothetical protein